jgi:hypothetical protein
MRFASPDHPLKRSSITPATKPATVITPNTHVSTPLNAHKAQFGLAKRGAYSVDGSIN